MRQLITYADDLVGKEGSDCTVAALLVVVLAHGEEKEC